MEQSDGKTAGSPSGPSRRQRRKRSASTTKAGKGGRRVNNSESDERATTATASNHMSAAKKRKALHTRHPEESCQLDANSVEMKELSSQLDAKGQAALKKLLKQK